MYHRGSRGFRRRSTPRPMVNTYKKVLNFVEASFTAGFQNEFLVQGKDGISPKQTSKTDGEVPTGSTVKYIEVQFAISNIVSTPCYINCSLQQVLGNQTAIDPDAVGGNKQRNQVFHQDMYVVGKDQNSNHKFKFKIPPKYRRVREGADWVLTWSNSASVNRAVQVVYKFQH